MPQKRKFLIYGILFSAIGLVTGIVLSMSFVSGIGFVLYILISIAFLKLKGGKKCQTNLK
jgi:uncharacterized oligopeptide transporter (OPT) family protein